MSQADISYSCGSCGYPLNLSSSNRITSAIGSEHQKSIKNGVISFQSVDLSRFTQVDKKVRGEDPSSKAFGRVLTRLTMDGVTPVMLLHDDCLSSIFNFLDSRTDRESFGLTCRRWLAIQNLNRRSLQFPCSFGISSLSQRSIDVNSFHLCRILTRFQHLEYLSLSGCIELTDSALNYLKHYGSRLQTLCLDCCFRISDYGFSLVGNGCPSLTTISLYRCNITDTGLEALANACLALRHVNLAYCAHISDAGLRALSEGCRDLRAVKISNCRGVTGVGLRGCSSTLVYIEAEGCNLKPEGIASMVSGGGLKFLNIAGLSSSNFRNRLEAIGNGFAARLKILNLRMCRSVTDESIAAIAKGCHNLEKLHVNRCRNLSDQGFQFLRDGCKQLSVLYMNRSCQISDTAVELFRLYRGNVEIRFEEVMSIGPVWDDLDYDE